MGSSAIAVAILAGVAVLAIAAYIAQSLESAREERRRKTLIIMQRVKNAQNILGELPNSYLPADIRQFLLQYLQNRYQEVLNVDPKNASAKEQLAAINTQLSTEYHSTLDSPEPVFKEVTALKRTAEGLKDLVNFFVNLHNENAIDKTLAKRYINKGKTLYAVAKLDRMYLTAQQTEATGTERSALVHYTQCRKRMEPFVKQNILPQRAKALDEKIQALQRQVAAKAPAKPDAANTAQAEWDKFDNPADDWKVKQDYD